MEEEIIENIRIIRKYLSTQVVVSHDHLLSHFSQYLPLTKYSLIKPFRSFYNLGWHGLPFAFLAFQSMNIQLYKQVDYRFDASGQEPVSTTTINAGDLVLAYPKEGIAGVVISAFPLPSPLDQEEKVKEKGVLFSQSAPPYHTHQILVGRYVDLGLRYYQILHVTEQKLKIIRLKINKFEGPSTASYGEPLYATKKDDHAISHGMKLYRFPQEFLSA